MSAPRRAVCTMAHGPHLALLDITGPAIARYAERHGYEAIEVRHRIDATRPVSWDKVALLRSLVTSYDLVVWVDADALVLDRAPDIEASLRPRRFLHLVEHRIDHHRVPNAGVIAMRGGRTSAAFLDRIWSARRFVHDKWWENAAILHLLGYRELHGLRPVLPSPWRLGMGTLPNLWNSIPADRAPDPYIAHFPGMELTKRLELLRALS
jgi:hypothetical protein